jgi:hypothetical protein
MRYVSESVGSQYWPKLFGTYEAELHACLTNWDAVGFRKVVDVGAAEGYYAVGCALRWPQAKVDAFESEEKGRQLVSAMAAANGVVDRVRVHGHATVASLRAAFPAPRSGPVLCIMDVEGAEEELADAEAVPALLGTHLLIETHEFAVPGIGNLLKERFHGSHDLTEIRPRPRTVADFAGSVPVAVRWALGRSLPFLVDEWRSAGCGWLLGTPRAESSPRRRDP